MYLLDTNVLSELRRNRPHGGVLDWLARTDDRLLHVSAVTFGELQDGVELTRRQDANAAAQIEKWIDEAAARFQIISLDVAVFRLWSRLMVGKPDTLGIDGLIAATALVHGLTVVTRNVRDFVALGLTPLNPFDHQA